MMRLVHAVCISFSLLLISPFTQATSRPASIEIDTGYLQGDFRKAPFGKKVVEYRGIPYEQSPTGTLRWSLPRPAKT